MDWRQRNLPSKSMHSNDVLVAMRYPSTKEDAEHTLLQRGMRRRTTRKEWKNAKSRLLESSYFCLSVSILVIFIGQRGSGGNTVVDAFRGTTGFERLIPSRGCSSASSYRDAVERGSFCARHASVTRSSGALRASLGDKDDGQDFGKAVQERLSRAFLPSLSVAGWPLVAAMGIPALVDVARSFPANSSEQIAAVTVLIVANRIYLYALGLTIVATAAVRGSAAGDPKELGQRLTVLTEELLVPKKPLSVAASSEPAITANEEKSKRNPKATAIEPLQPPAPTPSFVKKMVDNSGLEENLDGVDAGTQAVAIPLLVAGLLAVSVISLPFWSNLSEGLLESSGDATVGNEWISQLGAALSGVLPLLSQGWNALLLTVFTRSEFRRLGYELLGVGGEDSDASTTTVPAASIAAECLLAVAVTIYGAYYLQYWPAQNFVNSAIAILVARAIRLDSLDAVVRALALLVVYDGASVFLIPAAANAATGFAAGYGDGSIDPFGAATVSTTLVQAAASSNPAASAMGSVAMQKLSSGSFQPGLLVTKLDGDKLTGTLGLGDAVFPSILASFLKRFDEDCKLRNHNEGGDGSEKSRLFEASLGGYVMGCLACELAPTIATRGVPALVFIVPFMGLATLLAAVQAGSFEELCRYNNIDDTIESEVR